MLEVAEAQTAPISMVGAPPEAIRLGKIMFTSHQVEPELKRGDFFARSTRGRLVPRWETWHEKWYVRGINGWPM